MRQALNRRSMLGGALALFGALSACGRRKIWAPHRYYRYTIRIEVDGQTYALSNGGVLATNLDKIAGSSHYDFPMPAVAALPNGETLVVFPPSLDGAWEDAGIRLAGKTLESLPYRDGAYPSVFIFDNATRPNRVLGWLTAPGVKSGRTRVKLLQVENSLAATDQRNSVAKRLPWYAPTEKAHLLATNDSPTAAFRFQEENATLFEQPSNSFVPAHSLYSWVGTIFADGAQNPRQKLTRVYAAAGETLALGRSVQLPLQKVGEGSDATLVWSGDPLTFEFRPISDRDNAWAEEVAPGQVFGRKPVFAIERHSKLAPLGGFAAKRQEANEWSLEDQSLRGWITPVRLRLENSAVDEHAIVGGGGDFSIGG